MRLNFRVQIGNLTVFFMVSSTQRLSGVLSRADSEKRYHYLFFDLENCSLEDAKHQLRELQAKHLLPNIFIFSDRPDSFRAFCFKIVPRKQMLHVLTDPALKNIDHNFLHWTWIRGEATLRTSKKMGRLPQELVAVLPSYDTAIPDLVPVVYDTGLVKRGLSISIDSRGVRIHG